MISCYYSCSTHFRTKESSGDCANDSVSGLATKYTAAESTRYCTHETTIALLACSRIGGAVLALTLLVGVRVVGVLWWGVLVVRSLLRELVRGIARWVLSAATRRSACCTRGVVYSSHEGFD